MGLWNVNNTLGYLRTYRVCWIKGRYGGGKTAVAFRLAYELVASGFARYIFSNCNSIWNEKPENIRLREDGRSMFADAVCILDEGGLFLKTGADVDAYLSYLRKLNIMVIVPSVMPPATRMKFLSIQRILNLYSLGFPAWVYQLDLKYDSITEKDHFVWLNPTEIYGVYDTVGAPSDDGGLHKWLMTWTRALQSKGGYERKVDLVSAFKDFDGFQQQGASAASASPFGAAAGTAGALAEGGGSSVAASLQEAAEAMEQALSVHATSLRQQSRSRGR